MQRKGTYLCCSFDVLDVAADERGLLGRVGHCLVWVFCVWGYFVARRKCLLVLVGEDVREREKEARDSVRLQGRYIKVHLRHLTDLDCYARDVMRAQRYSIYANRNISLLSDLLSSCQTKNTKHKD
jgi:hypothetical protein